MPPASTPPTVNGDWLIRARDGRLAVYACESDAVVCRTQRHPGGPWTAPRVVGGDQHAMIVDLVKERFDGTGERAQLGTLPVWDACPTDCCRPAPRRSPMPAATGRTGRNVVTG